MIPRNVISPLEPANLSLTRGLIDLISITQRKCKTYDVAFVCVTLSIVSVQFVKSPVFGSPSDLAGFSLGVVFVQWSAVLMGREGPGAANGVCVTLSVCSEAGSLAARGAPPGPASQLEANFIATLTLL